MPAITVFVATTDCTWGQLSTGFGPSGPTTHRRFAEWSRGRQWGKLHRPVPDELRVRRTLELSRGATDSVQMRVRQSASREAIAGSGRQLTGTPRMTRAQSRVAPPVGKRSGSSKKDDAAERTRPASTCQALVRSSIPSR